MRGSATVVAVASLLAGGGAARAATSQPAKIGGAPFVLTAEPRAQKPDVAVDEAGSGHFAWSVDAPYPETDPLVYCRVPRGATACADTKRFPLPQEAFGETQVLAPGGGVVILLTYRGYGSGEGLYAVISTDGGLTFAAPKVIADNVQPGQAVYGPGENAVSVTNDVVGSVDFQAASLDGLTTASADVGSAGAGRGYNGTIGFPDPATPLIAYGDGNSGYFRLWSGKGSVNDVSTWLPEQKIGAIEDLRIGTGPKGVVLLASDPISPGSAFNKYTARRFDTSTNTFGPPVDVSNPKIETDVISRDIVQDAGGNLTAAFVANGTFPGDHTDPIRYRASVDGGKTWQPERTLVTETNDGAYNLQLGAAPDGGGFLTYDGNSLPPLKAVAFPPVGAGGGGGGAGGLPCVPTLTVGDAQAIATAGCLQKRKDGTYTTSDPVRMNGLDLVPQTASGRRARAAAKAEIELDPKTKKVRLTATNVKAGNIVLDKGTFDWDVSKGAASVTTFAHLEKFKVEIFGFPVTGSAELRFDGKKAIIPVHLALPKVFGGVTADVDLRLENPGGLKLDGFKIHVGQADLGALRISPLDVTYKGGVPSVFEGNATLLLPPAYGAPGARVAFGFVDGKFKHAEGTVPFTPPLALAPPWAYLQSIGLALSTDPLYIAGGVSLIGGPQVLGKAALKIDALPPKGFSFTFGDPSVLRIEGALSVVDIPLADGYVEYRTNGVLQFAGGLNFTAPLGIASVTAGIPTGPPLGPAFVDLNDGRFNAPIEGKTCVPASCIAIETDAQGVISSKGIAACGSYGLSDDLSVSVGLGYYWGGDADAFAGAGGCDVSPYAESLAPRQAGGAQTVQVPAGLPQENIQVLGTGGTPRVTIKSPDGETLTTSGDGLAKSAHMVAYGLPGKNVLTVLAAKPAAGTWTITPVSGSPAIAKVAHADGLPEPKVSAKLGGKGYSRTLRYSVTPIAGQTVRFLERAAGVGTELGTAKGTKGTLRFHPAAGPKGTRQIVAQVEQDGLARRQIVVASYTAPATQLAGRPAFVRVKRAGSKLKVRWGRAARATGYVVRVQLKDGTSKLFNTRPSERSLTIPIVTPRTSGSVTVAAYAAGTAKPGPARRAGVKKKKAKKKRH